MQFPPHNISFWPFFLKLIQGVELFCLKLVQIFINDWCFDCVSLAEISFFKVIVFDDFFLMPGNVIEIVNSMAECTVVFVKNAETTEIETTERTFLFQLGLVLNHLNYLVLDFLLVKLHRVKVVLKILLKLFGVNSFLI